MTARPLVFGVEQRRAVAKLMERAHARPVQIQRVMHTIQMPGGDAAHRAHMTAQTILIPVGFQVTYSVEDGQPVGRCRHMSISTDQEGHIPSPDAVWMVAEELGFRGGLDVCAVWSEDLSDGGIAVNVVQPVAN